jgi:hypothetical protein
VIIVPDGSRHALNFETLIVDGATSHYWIEDATVALVPSLAILRAKTPQPARLARLLVVGDPLPADPAFPPLPHLKAEIRTIAADFPEADRAVYTGAQAYAEHFREGGPGAFSAIHFAAHASANDESPLNSAIILSPHGGNYKLYVSDVAGLHIEPDVVTISACRSAGAKAYSGEGLIGFAWAFLEAGAHNVVAGIWNVDDAAAPLLMQEFYRGWRAHGNSAVALRNAKLKLMRSGGAFGKPYYWGPFEIFTSGHALGDGFGLEKQQQVIRPAALESVPDMLNPPNGCAPTMAPVHLRFKYRLPTKNLSRASRICSGLLEYKARSGRIASRWQAQVPVRSPSPLSRPVPAEISSWKMRASDLTSAMTVA